MKENIDHLVDKAIELGAFEVAFDPGGKLLPTWYSMVLID